MGITRSPQTVSYTNIPNVIIEDTNLSFSSLGMLVYLLSKPDDWECHLKDLKSRVADSGKPQSRDALRGVLRELIDAQYIERSAKRGKGGVMAGQEYRIFDFSPISEFREEHKQKYEIVKVLSGLVRRLDAANGETSKPETDNPSAVGDSVVQPETDNPSPVDPKAVSPSPVDPETVNPAPVKPDSKVSTDLLVTTDKEVTTDKQVTVSAVKQDYSADFEMLWKFRPRRQGSGQ